MLMKVRVIPECPRAVVGRDFVGVHEAHARRHPPSGVVGVAVARDVQAVRVKIGRPGKPCQPRRTVGERQCVLEARPHAYQRRCCEIARGRSREAIAEPRCHAAAHARGAELQGGAKVIRGVSNAST